MTHFPIKIMYCPHYQNQLAYMQEIPLGFGILSARKLEHYIKDPDLLKKTVCSYSFGSPAFGPAIAFWFYDEDDLDHFVTMKTIRDLKYSHAILNMNHTSITLQGFVGIIILDIHSMRSLLKRAFVIWLK